MDKLKNNQSAHNESDKILKWQHKLLPWFIIMPTVLVGVFIYLASHQLVKFNNAIETKPEMLLVGDVLPNPMDSTIHGDLFNNQKYLQWITLTKLEQESLHKRYNQGGLLLMSRIFTKYMGFFTGMILSIVGAVFIIGKIREGTSKIEGSANELMKFSIISSSPGIVFGVLGTFLMITTIVTHNEIEIQDSPLYLNASTLISIELVNSLEKENTFKMDTDLAKALKDMDSTAINDSSTLNAVNEFIEKWSTLEKDD